MAQIGTPSYIKPSRPTTISCTNSSTDNSVNKTYQDTSDNASIVPSILPHYIQLGSDTSGSDKKQDTAGKTDHTTDQEYTESSSICFDHSGVDRREESTSRINVQERNMAKNSNDELAAHNLGNTISHCGSGVVTKSGLIFEKAQFWERTPKNSDIMRSNSRPINDTNLENSRRKLFHEPTDCNAQSIVDDGHIYCTSQGKRIATNYVSGVPPFSSQSQFIPSHQLCGTLEVPSDCMAIYHNAVSQHLCGLHRRSLFNEKVRDPTMRVHCGSNLGNPSCTTRHRSIFDDNYLNPLGSPACTIPGIGLHPNVSIPISEYNNEATEDPLSKMTCHVNPTLLIRQ
ncbi:hypothetical protein GUJ93_ZPchr0003g18155 [Zizania palustris]|uniref:Uncharacterized protein n=2 Tax=Zizania palustris TaxID=103762 RepID=A0A8J5SVP2_ZIZPA|nr:hypothetical protein GUJ93_ZPchr0003g18155 [Zizania palustris]KAG8062816.1 hypothetical protein GUJ93_ZPchr0003g18155 [Zizania palustris]KAG8062817.1 hypothetical protein GUJ93_ZPchr0003g18155 [Zizania palustris]